MSRIVRALAALSVGLIMTAFVFGVLEGLARQVLPPPESPNEAGSVTDEFNWRMPAPYVVFRAKPDSDVVITDKLWVRLRRNAGEGDVAHVVTDEHGFRYAGDVNEPREPGELRVFLLGGSVAINGMTNDSTICGFLERRIAADPRARGRRVRCVTAAIQTAVSDQELAMLVHHVADHEPDVVISLSGMNDLVARTELDPRLGHPSTWSLHESVFLGRHVAVERMRAALAAVSTPRLLLSRSRLATALVPGLGIDQALSTELARISVDDPARPTHAEIVDHLMATWERMRLFSEAIGARFHAVLQPCAPDARERARNATFYDLANAAVDDARRRGLPYTTLDRCLDDHPDLFYDPVHTLDAGNALLADALFEILDRGGALDVDDGAPHRSGASAAPDGAPDRSGPSAAPAGADAAPRP